MNRKAHETPEAFAFHVSDAAAFANCSRETIRRAIDTGQLPAHLYFNEGRRKIMRDELISWMRSQPLYKPAAIVDQR